MWTWCFRTSIWIDWILNKIFIILLHYVLNSISTKFVYLHSNKVVLVIPQQTRRMYNGGLGPSWQPRFRKSSLGNEVHYQKYHHTPPVHHFPKKSAYRSPPFPHGGDDFDQGYEHVNHVRIPHGKDISHAISFGKGYIPYDKIKGSFSLGRERWEYLLFFLLFLEMNNILIFVFLKFEIFFSLL